MSSLAFEVIGARAEHFTPYPQIVLRLRITERTGVDVYSIALRAQVQLEPQRRRYSPGEGEKLHDIFDVPARYGDTLKPFMWAQIGTTVTGFKDSIEIDLALPCSYDFDVGANKYLASLEEGEIPILALFNGTLYEKGPNGVQVDIVPWSSEARFRIPVGLWRETMDALFPGTAWIRLERDTFEELQRFKSLGAYPTWEAAMRAMLDAGTVPR